MKYSFFQKLFAELLGTFFLATVVLVTLTPAIPFPVATPIAAAIALGISVYMFGDVSGSHINPAISLAMWLSGKIDSKTFIGYIVFQFIGAALALLLVSVYVPVDQEKYLIVHHATMGSALGEAVGAAFFSFCVMSTTYSKSLHQAIVGVFVAISLLLGITIAHNSSFGILNPAVALATKSWAWDYFLMPFIGAIVGALVCMLLYKRKIG